LAVSWIPLFAWLGAVVVAAVVLGFCAYEIVWKTRRLERDVQHLQGLGDGVAQLQSQLAATQQRLARAGVG
jgi:outer membrane murein-binding lipoprotein Lpp